jgi:hypothetical protein
LKNSLQGSLRSSFVAPVREMPTASGWVAYQRVAVWVAVSSLQTRAALVAGVVGLAALLSAAPAAADDQTFLEVLDMMGVPVTDPAAAIEMGRAACAGLDAGQSIHQVADTIGPPNGLVPEQAGMVIGASVAAYCHQHSARVCG